METKVNTYKITFSNGDTITTGMNATLSEAETYYFEHAFQFGDTQERPFDYMVKAVKVETVTN